MRRLTVTLTALALALAPAAFLSQAQAAGSYEVTLKSSATSTYDGQKVTFTGKVSPAAPGGTIKIQYFVTDQGGNQWRTWRTGTIRSDGSYSRTFTPFDGEKLWRVVKPAGSGRSGGASAPVTIKGYTWFKMSNFGDTLEYVRVASGKEFLGQYGPTTVAGRSVSQYYASNPDGSGTTRWLTDRRCKKLKVDVGLGDNSDPGTSSQFRVFAGADRVASQRIYRDKITVVDVNVTASETPSFKFTSENKTAGATYTNASNPRMLCAFLHNLG